MTTENYCRALSPMVIIHKRINLPTQINKIDLYFTLDVQLLETNTLQKQQLGSKYSTKMEIFVSQIVAHDVEDYN
jgi:hypothetical protein